MYASYLDLTVITRVGDDIQDCSAFSADSVCKLVKEVLMVGTHPDQSRGLEARAALAVDNLIEALQIPLPKQGGAEAPADESHALFQKRRTQAVSDRFDSQASAFFSIEEVMGRDRRGNEAGYHALCNSLNDRRESVGPAKVIARAEAVISAARAFRLSVPHFPVARSRIELIGNLPLEAAAGVQKYWCAYEHHRNFLSPNMLGSILLGLFYEGAKNLHGRFGLWAEDPVTRYEQKRAALGCASLFGSMADSTALVESIAPGIRPRSGKVQKDQALFVAKFLLAKLNQDAATPQEKIVAACFLGRMARQLTEPQSAKWA